MGISKNKPIIKWHHECNVFLNEEWIYCVIYVRNRNTTTPTPKLNFGFVKWCTCAVTENKLPKLHSHTSSDPSKDWKVMILLEIVHKVLAADQDWELGIWILTSAMEKLLLWMKRLVSLFHFFISSTLFGHE